MFFRSGKIIPSIIIKFFEIFFKTILVVPRGTCRFYPSCGDFAQEAIRTLPLFQAIPKITIRILKCNPLFKGGYDPVMKDSRKAYTL
jgi:uncharacterized protein